MMTIVMCVIALSIAFILYSQISGNLPAELQLPALSSNSSLTEGGAGLISPASSYLGSTSATSSNWQIRGNSPNLEISRDFQGSVTVNGTRYDAPTLVLTCFEGELFVRVNLKMQVATVEGKAQVLTANGPQQWNLGQGFDIYSPYPKSLMAAVKKEIPFDLVVPYAELGPRKVVFLPIGGAKITANFGPACKQ
jgi:hypothetical protein